MFDARTGDLGKPAEEMSKRSRELVASDESTILAKPLLDAVVVKSSQSDRCLSNPANTNESGWDEIFRETNDFLDQLVAPETGPWRWWR